MFVGVHIRLGHVCWCSEKVGACLLMFRDGRGIFVGVQRRWGHICLCSEKVGPCLLVYR